VKSSIGYVAIEEKAKMARDNVPSHIEDLVDEVFGRSVLSKAAPSIKERVYRNELAFRNNQRSAIAEQRLVRVANERVRRTALPEHMRWGKRQLRMNREETRFFVRHFAGSDPTKGTVSDDMSPLEAVFIAIDLTTQKLFNPEFRVPPEQWEKAAAARRAKASARAKEQSPVHGPQEPFTARPMLMPSLPAMQIPDVSDESSAAVLEIHSVLDSLGFER
jgi:hypothetical protein